MVNKQLLSESVQRFIRDHENDDERSLVLQHPVIEGVAASVIATQIAGRRKAKDKLPVFYQTSHIIYPPAVNLEQSSSDTTARLKAELILRDVAFSSAPVGGDLSGGFGVDSFFLSRICSSFHYVEPDQSLLELVMHNHTQLGASNIEHHHATAEAYLAQNQVAFDFLYLDPSRRRDGNQKIFKLVDAVPSVPSLLPQIFRATRSVLIKTSPLMDITQAIDELSDVKNVYIISVKNECKELLLLLQKDYDAAPMVEAINIVPGKTTSAFSFLMNDESRASATFHQPLTYLYEPNASILKAGAFKLVAERYGVQKLHSSTHLYTSDAFVSGFPGRVFKILGHVKAEGRSIAGFFPDGKANITTRNYPLTVEELRKKTKLKEGGDRYLIAFSGPTRKYVVVAERAFPDL